MEDYKLTKLPTKFALKAGTAIGRAHLEDIRRRRAAVRAGKADLVDGPTALRQARAALRK